MFNLSTSLKPEVNLYKNLIDEVIEMYGIPVKYLFVEKMNKNQVFKDFSHLELNPEIETKEIYLLPEDASDWEGDVVFNQFGFYNQWTQHLFISRDKVLELYPDFDEEHGRSKMVNNLIVTPSSTVLEITHVETYSPGINNLWGFSDRTSVYRLSTKIYDNNIADNIDYKDTMTISEDPEGSENQEDVIFSENIEIDTSIDEFFNSLTSDIQETENLAENGDDKGSKPSNTDSPFGNLS